MSAIPRVDGDGSKRWLAVLGAAVLVSIVILTHSFVNALSPSKREPVAAQTSAASAEKRSRGGSPIGTPPRPVARFRRFSGRPTQSRRPFAAQDAEPAAAKTRWLLSKPSTVRRNTSATSSLRANFPKGLGNLTKEQVDEMEKKGITIEVVRRGRRTHDHFQPFGDAEFLDALAQRRPRDPQ